jgi:hypothetical protein
MAEGATKFDDNLMTMFSHGGHAAQYVRTLLNIAEIAEFGHQRLKSFLPATAQRMQSMSARPNQKSKR